MSAELKQYIEKCLAHRTSQTKEPLIQHHFLARPWSRVAEDLCELNGCTLKVASDCYSSYIEVSRLTTVTSKAVIKALKEIFARFGIPDEVVSDNGPQFSSAEFAVFGKTYIFGFAHVTSSPTHAQLNLLQRTRECNLKLNPDKSKIRQPEVLYIGHIEAITKMPKPDDKQGVQRLLGMVNYVAKFAPNISEVTVPLRELLKKDVA